jgi:hypothetical protein
VQLSTRLVWVRTTLDMRRSSLRTPSGHEMELTEDPSGHETEFAMDPPAVL